MVEVLDLVLHGRSSDSDESLLDKGVIIYAQYLNVIDQIEHCHHVQDLDEPGIGARPDGIAHHRHDKQAGKEVFEDNNPFLLHPLGIRSSIVDELLLAMQKPEDDGEVTHHLQENDRSIDIA